MSKSLSSNTDSTSGTKKIKVPRSFIGRPSPNINPKSCCKVFAHQSILKAVDIAAGSIVHITKEDNEAGVIGIINSGDENVATNVVQLSSTLRSLGGIMLGDRVEIKKLSTLPPYAAVLTIARIDGVELPARAKKALEKLLDDISIIQPGMVISKASIPGINEGDEKIIADLIIVDADGMPDIKKLRINDSILEDNSNQKLVSAAFLFKRGTTSLEFTTNIHSTKDKYNFPRVINYDNVGGLKKQIDLLKSTVELPLHQPELFTDFGITPPRGILLHGPPGTGKTMLLRAVANETNAHVLTVNGPSIVSKYLGETENAIREIFSEARKYQPAIIFIDEIDSLAPSRNSDDSGEVESRVVATLLTLMDGMGDSGRLVVVAATNRPNNIDNALRRPGRFDHEVEIGIPDVSARYDILMLQFSRNNKHELKEEEIYSIASKTHGYVGADLVALCRESVMKTIKRGLASGIERSQLKVSFEDVEAAFPEIRPSAMREIFLEMPKVRWADIGGQEELKRKLIEVVQLPLEAADTFKKLGVSAPKGVLLYGPPGCSKTLTAKALATESGINFLAVKGPEIFNKYVGESERAIREIFRKARAASPSIIFFDEIDALSPDRSEGGSTSAANHVLTSLLNEIDGVEELKGVVIVAATNRPDTIDPALLRPGRLDRHIYVAPPDHGARLQILQKCTQKMSIDDKEISLEEYATKTEGCSGAEVSLLCQEAGLAAIMEDNKAEIVHKKHFDLALSSISRGITEEMLNYYKEFSKRTGVCI